MSFDDYTDLMEAEHEAFERLREEVLIVSKLLDAAELECCTWHEDLPNDSEKLIVDSIYELCMDYAEERATIQSFNNNQVEARHTVLKRFNDMLMEKKKKGEVGAE